MANATRRRLVRLKEPRYLIGALFGAFYIASFVIRPQMGMAAHPRESTDPALYSTAGLGILVFALLNLVFGSSETLRFSQAEVDFLFTAPLTRRQIVGYKLLAAQPAILLSATLAVLFRARSSTAAEVLTSLVGTWILFATLHLHFAAVALTRRGLAEHGITGFRRRLVFLAIAGAIVATVTTVAWTNVPRWLETLSAGGDREAVLREIVGSPAMQILLQIPKAIVAPAFASHPLEFAGRLPSALLILGLHYVWVIPSDAAFEEVAAESAQRRAARARVATADGRGASVTAPSSRPFVRLAPNGSAVLAIAWKNLAGFARNLGLSLRILLFASFFAVTLSISFARGGGLDGRAIGLFLFMFAVAVIVFGPMFLRLDLRQDLLLLDVLKVYPLRGAEIVAGEILAPVVVLASLTSVCWIGGYVAVELAGDADSLLSPSLLVSMLVLSPSVLFVLVLIQNAAALVFPAWVTLGPERTAGVEVLGQRLVLMMGTMLGAAVMVAPAALMGGGLYWLLRGLAGEAGSIPASLVAAFVLLGEVAVGVLLLGRVFERLDPTTAGITGVR